MKRIFLILTLLFLTPFLLFSQKVYTPLPGASEKINTEEIIQKLLEVKKIPITKIEDENKDIQIEIEILKDFRNYLSDLNNKSKGMYDFQSPFKEMVGTSSDPTVVNAVAERNSIKQTYKIQVIQIAHPDSFMSDSLPRDKILPPGKFTVTIDKKVISIKFPGGTLAQLAATLEEQGGTDYWVVRLMNDTPATSVLQVNGKKTGKKYQFKFDGDLKPLFEAGLLVEKKTQTQISKIDFSYAKSASRNLLFADNNQITLKPNSDAEIDLSTNMISIEQGTLLVYDAIINLLPISRIEPEESEFPHINAALMEPVVVSNLYSNVLVEGPGLIPFYEDKKKPPKLISNFTKVISLVLDNSKVVSLDIRNTGSFTNDLSEFAGRKIVKILLRNANTDREITIDNLQFVTITEEGGIQPKNEITKASDAILNLDGIKIIRENNEITNVINGVTINLVRESDHKVTLTIDHNYELVKESIINWVDSYNKAMSYLHILTRNNLDKTPLHQRPDDMLATGIYQAELTFNSFRNRLRLAVMNSYPTVLGSELALLSQIGIYTKKAGATDLKSSEWENVKAGVLSIDTSILESALHTKFDAIEQLFASDNDGDLVKDNGVALVTTRMLSDALSSVGFIQSKIDLKQKEYKDNEKDIGKMKKDLEKYELDLRIKYGKLNEAIISSESKKNWLENFAPKQ